MLQAITMSTTLLTATDAQSPNCGWQTIDKDPNSPTYNPVGLTCGSGKCCSKDGYCTSGQSDCQAGCQSDFGTCNAPVCGVGVAGDSDNHVCGQSGQCCSSEGFCGNDDSGEYMLLWLDRFANVIGAYTLSLHRLFSLWYWLPIRILQTYRPLD